MDKVVANVTRLQMDGKNTCTVNSFKKDYECVSSEVISLAYIGELQFSEGRYTHVCNSRTQEPVSIPHPELDDWTCKKKCCRETK